MGRKIDLELYAHEKDVTTIVKKIQDTIPALRWSTISIGDCGWANAMDCWWIEAKVDHDEKVEIVDFVKENEIELYNPALIY